MCGINVEEFKDKYIIIIIYGNSNTNILMIPKSGVKGQGAHNIITAPFAIGKRFLLAQCGLKIREP